MLHLQVQGSLKDTIGTFETGPCPAGPKGNHGSGVSLFSRPPGEVP